VEIEAKIPSSMHSVNGSPAITKGTIARRSFAHLSKENQEGMRIDYYKEEPSS